MRKPKAFTLIELLVVIAIIAVLLSILIPSLNLAKDHAKRIGCSANLRSLALATILYTESNDNLTPSSTNTCSLDGTWRAGWVGQTWDLDTHTQIYGNNSATVGLHKSQLWPYIENTKAWRCPTDPDREQLRSYCMAAQWWGRYTENDNSVSYDSQTTGLVCRKISDLKGPPSERFIFIDGAGGNTDGYFAIWYGTSMWWNIPQFRHGGGSVNGFADGHVEPYKMDAETVKMAAEAAEDPTGMYWMPQDRLLPDSEDLKYYQTATWGSMGW